MENNEKPKDDRIFLPETMNVVCQVAGIVFIVLGIYCAAMDHETPFMEWMGTASASAFFWKALVMLSFAGILTRVITIGKNMKP